MKRKIYSAEPSITKQEIQNVADAIKNAWYDGLYAYISEFEEAVADYVSRRYALALPSGTLATHKEKYPKLIRGDYIRI